VLRVAGNGLWTLTPSWLAEYASCIFNVPLVVVIGHENCGAVKACLKGDPASGNLGRLLSEVQVGNNSTRWPQFVAMSFFSGSIAVGE